MLEVNRDAYLIGEKAVEAHKILGSEEKSGTTYLYLQAVFRWFGFENGIFTTISGGGDVVRMQLVKSGTGEYEVTEYKCAMGGGTWEKSIRDMFPRDLAEKVIRDNAVIGEELWNMQVDKARTYLKEIGREEAPIEPVVKKNKESEGASRAICQVISMRRGFPDWVGTREMIFNAGGGPFNYCPFRCVLETRCEPAQDGSYTVTLIKTWETPIKNKQPICTSIWKYKVSGDKIELVESADNDSFMYRIK